jgi:predicted transcriptional regulator
VTERHHILVIDDSPPPAAAVSKALSSDGGHIARVMRQGCRVVTPMALMSSLAEQPLAEKVRSAGINSYISTSMQRGVDAIDNEIQAWLAGTKCLRQERA